MDPAPRAYADLPSDPDLGRPVPFACGTGDRGTSARELDGRRVTQCALSRVCGVCGSPLGRPIAFLGSEDEVGRNAFHFPASHLECVEALASAYAGVGEPVLGQLETVDSWVIVTTAGFEFMRSGKEDVDRRPTFQPNSLLEERRIR
jgi:hypothetical protein